MLVEAKIRLKEIDLDFLKKYEKLGFNSEEELLSQALKLLKKELENVKKIIIEDSADLYAEVYEEDEEAKEWIESSNNDWK